MASIKQIDENTVHRIQSGQVIIDLCSVVKELLENSVDAGATSIDIRFKNQGLDLVEVQDNGSGIPPDNFAMVALKNYTSKLSNYEDLAYLETFGFRGEALSSLCALARLTITTCQPSDVPRGSKIEFEQSGKLKAVSVVAAQKGTTVAVENLYHNLPVRRRELERNIKREWSKVIALLNQFACILSGVRISVSQQPNKGKRTTMFSTKGNPSVRENVINIFGAKAMATLIPLDLQLELVPTVASLVSIVKGVRTSAKPDLPPERVEVQGFVSRPAHGEGRQVPDRQMFFVNCRPCGLPQFAKVFNDVYRAYNASQSPFILADIRLNTSLYDVNVSPDKRTILLHDQGQLLESLRQALIKMFDGRDYALPKSQALLHHAQPPEIPSVGQNPSEIPSAPGLQQPRLSSVESSSTPDSPTPDHLGDSPGPYQDMGRQQGEDELAREGIIPSATCIFESQLSKQAAPSSTSVFDTMMKATPVLRTKCFSKSSPAAVRGVQKPPSFGSSSVGSIQRFRHGTSSLGTTPSSPAGRVTENSPYPEDFQPVSQRDSPPASDDDDDDDDDDESGDSDSPTSPTRPGLGGRGREPFTTHASGYPRSTGDSRRAPAIAQTPHPPSGFPKPNQPLRRIGPSSHNHGEIGRNDAINHTNADIDTGDDATSDSDAEDSCSSHDSSTSGEVEISGKQTGTSDDHIPNKKAAIAPLPGKFASLGSRFGRSRDSTARLVHQVSIDEEAIRSGISDWKCAFQSHHNDSRPPPQPLATSLGAPDAEETLSLIISKSDFSRMRIVGQFNLGFILAVRPSVSGDDDELFIIDQHASDEKYNFERLQAETSVQSQPLVQSKQLDLTAWEEEIVLNNLDAIEANGFRIQVDDSGTQAVGSRCRLLALPLSRETTFTLSDLQELIYMLGEESSEAGRIPRPSKVRKMFATRACRSSIMIGKALSRSQMEKVVRHMGELDKPWNCPHGRPTMRHLSAMRGWNVGGLDDFE